MIYSVKLHLYSLGSVNLGFDNLPDNTASVSFFDSEDGGSKSSETFGHFCLFDTGTPKDSALNVDAYENPSHNHY
jgi:hypothetical protein